MLAGSALGQSANGLLRPSVVKKDASALRRCCRSASPLLTPRPGRRRVLEATGMTGPELQAVRTPPGMPRPAPLWRSTPWERPGTEFTRRAFQATDLLSGLLALGAAFLALNLDQLPRGLGEFLALRITVQKVLLLGVFAACWNRAFSSLGLYRRSRIAAEGQEVARIAAACSLGTLPTLLFVLFSATRSFTVETVPLFWTISIAAVIAMREAIRALGTSLSDQGPRDVLVVGSGPRAQALCRALSESAGGGTNGARLVGFVDTNHGVTEQVVRQRWLGTLEDLETVLMRRVVDEVIIALPFKSCYQQIQNVIHTCERVGVQSTYLADIFQPSLGRVRYEHMHPFAIATVKVVQDDFRLAIKRAVDVVGAALGLLLLAPLLLVIAATMKLTDLGPVLFAQQRYGLNKRLFRMYKFRTMVPGAEALQSTLEGQNEAQGPVFKMAKDPRVTGIGALLRRTSLDEIPQLWNVLKGEMSLVGPRPLPVRDVGRFEEGWLMRRFSMRPGLTCQWQITGRSHRGFDAWVGLDLEYIDNWSLRLDCLILLKTIPAVLRGTGAQ